MLVLGALHCALAMMKNFRYLARNRLVVKSASGGGGAERGVQVPRGGGSGRAALFALGAGGMRGQGDVAFRIKHGREPADLDFCGKVGRAFVLVRAVIARDAQARFDLRGVREKIFRRLAFAGNKIVVARAGAGRILRADAAIHDPLRAGFDVARSVRRLPKKIGHGALREGPPFGTVWFVERKRGGKIVGDAVRKSLAVG